MTTKKTKKPVVKTVEERVTDLEDRMDMLEAAVSVCGTSPVTGPSLLRRMGSVVADAACVVAGAACTAGRWAKTKVHNAATRLAGVTA